MTILTLRGVGKRFGGLPAVDDVSFEVARGQVFAIIGPNGAGKSTLLRMISGLTTPSTSEGIWFEGTDLTGQRPHRIRHLGVGTVLQTPRVFSSMTVLENAALGGIFGSARRRAQTEARASAMEQLALLDLADKASWDVDALNLHHKRLLDLARALAGRPRLLLLDEVMAGLNPAELESFIAVIRRVRDELGITVVWVEHVMKAINALADHVFVMDFGRELAAGIPAVVMRDARVVEAYLGRGAVRDA
ncbi:MAG: ABC transporter ATP-binding protein [Nitriliruptoraceae bacterium]|nr:ABC transporter ATP-binding protein [Nitriliruptoraceae bacterium]